MAEAIDRTRTCNLSVNIRSNRFLTAFSRENRARYSSYKLQRQTLILVVPSHKISSRLFFLAFVKKLVLPVGNAPTIGPHPGQSSL
jgi:hypothetical protein